MVFLIVAVAWDLRSWRIPNAVTFTAALAGLAYNGYMTGVAGLEMSGLGLLVGLGLLFIPFVLGGLGGGDVKLLAALGAWLGPKGIVFATLYSGIAGGVLALVAMVASREGKVGSVRSIYEDLIFFVTFRERRSVSSRGKRRIPYSLAIASGALVFLLFGVPI